MENENIIEKTGSKNKTGIVEHLTKNWIGKVIVNSVKRIKAHRIM